MANIRNLPFLLWFYVFLFRIRPLQIMIRKLREEGNIEEERAKIRQAEDIWGKAICERIGIKLNVKGLENIPIGPVVFVSNHQGYCDIPVFFAAIPNKQFGFVAKSNLGRLPQFGVWIRDIRSVFIERDDVRSSLKAFEKGAELLKKGFSLTIFPEGTRSKGETMGEFKRGSLRLATKAGVPIIPVTINGTYRAYEEKGYLQPAEVDFVVHSAIETKNLTRKEASELSDTVEEIIRKEIEKKSKEQLSN